MANSKKEKTEKKESKSSKAQNSRSKFVSEKRGLSWEYEANNYRRICSPILVCAKTRSDKAENWGRVIRLDDQA